MEQLTFENTTETTLFDRISDIVDSVCTAHEVDKKCIKIYDTKDGYSVGIIDPTTDSSNLSVRAFNISQKGKKENGFFNITIRANSIKQINNLCQFPITSDIVSFSVNDESAFTFIKTVFDYELRHFTPSYQFGCCSRYEKCSDNKKCIHPNKLYAKACQYRENLEAGRIFYGKNRKE